MKLSEKQIDQALQKMEGWNLNGDSLQKEFAFDNFREGLGFVNKIGDIAEEIDHHPDITLTYSSVVVSLYTHSLGGITDKDVELAKKIDRI